MGHRLKPMALVIHSSGIFIIPILLISIVGGSVIVVFTFDNTKDSHINSIQGALQLPLTASNV